jgi:hypothetical protein
VPSRGRDIGLAVGDGLAGTVVCGAGNVDLGGGSVAPAPGGLEVGLVGRLRARRAGWRGRSARHRGGGGGDRGGDPKVPESRPLLGLGEPPEPTCHLGIGDRGLQRRGHIVAKSSCHHRDTCRLECRVHQLTHQFPLSAGQFTDARTVHLGVCGP